MSEYKINSESELVFLNSIFPVLSETFLFDQYSLLLKHNTSMAIVSSNQVDESQIHPNMREIQKQVHYLCHTSLINIIHAHLYFFIKHPINYCSSLIEMFFLEEKVKTSIAHITGAAIVFKRYKKMRWLHSHFTYGSTAIAMWLKRITKTPYSITLHGADLTYDDPADLEKKLKEADHIFSISQFNIDYINKKYPLINTRNSSVIPLGVSENNFSLNKSVKQNKQLTLLNVGRLSEHKAQHLLVEACVGLRDLGLDFKCYIIGEGPKRSFLEQLIEKEKLQNQVVLLGAVYHEEVMQWYSKADVFVLSSITEGMPLVIMEAMQKNLVVVAPKLSGIPELLDQGRTGLLFEAGSVDSLIKSLKSIIDGHVNLSNMRLLASHYIQGNFNVDKNTLKFQHKLTSLYNDIN